MLSPATANPARYGFLRWGADGKVRQLDDLYPHLRVEEPISGPAGTIGAPVEHLDREEGQDEVVCFVLDLSEQKRAADALS